MKRHNGHASHHDAGRKVWKFPLPGLFDEGWERITVPVRSKVVMAGHQDGIPTVWLEVGTKIILSDKKPAMENRVFYLYGTGHDIHDGDRHVGSYQEGALVWHIYEATT